MNQALPSLQILLLDACRSDPFGTADRGIASGLRAIDSSEYLRGGEFHRPSKGTLLGFSTSPGNVAEDGGSGNSTYATALAEAILLPNLELEGVFKRVRRIVKERTKGKQEPWENAALYGDFFFQQAPQVGNFQADVDYWELASLVDSIEAMRRYLDKFPTGQFAGLAEQKIENMNKGFSYKRKSEVFDILSLDEVTFNLCDGIDNKYFNPYKFRSLYRDSIVYLSVNLIFQKFNCDRLLLTNDGGETKSKNISPDHPVYIATAGEMFSFSLPSGGTEFSNYLDDEGLGIRYEGLVRVRETAAEESLAVVFDPIDPASVGMTWKFENTKRLYRSLKTGEYILGKEKYDLRDAYNKEYFKYIVSQERLAELGLPVSVSIKRGGKESSLYYDSFWLYDGSILGMAVDFETRYLIFLKPSNRHKKLGIKKNNFSFFGTKSPASYSGKSYSFRSGCKPVPFFVDGITENEDNRIVFKGQMPLLGPGCKVSGKKTVQFSMERMSLY